MRLIRPRAILSPLPSVCLSCGCLEGGGEEGVEVLESSFPSSSGPGDLSIPSGDRERLMFIPEPGSLLISILGSISFFCLSSGVGGSCGFLFPEWCIMCGGKRCGGGGG